MALDNPTIAEITMFGGNFAPRGWAFCDGQLLPINAHQALFSLLGTTYGGDGRTTFALPDLRGRAPIHSGNGSRGPGLSSRPLGQRSGEEIVTLSVLQMPNHTHIAQAATTGASISGTASAVMYSNATPGTDAAGGNFIANNDGGDGFATTTDRSKLNENAIAVDTSNLTVDIAGLNVTNLSTGGSQPHNNMQPYLAINYIIALTGTFPSRS